MGGMKSIVSLHLLKRTVDDGSALLGTSGRASVSSKLRMYMQTSPASFLIGAMTWLHMNLVPAREKNKKQNDYSLNVNETQALYKNSVDEQ